MISWLGGTVKAPPGTGTKARFALLSPAGRDRAFRTRRSFETFGNGGLTGHPRRDGTGLDIHAIIRAAWELVDDEGLDALSTRSLAARLGVKGPALYWHVGSMQELHGRMIEHILRDSVTGIAAPSAWPEWLRLVAREQRRILLSHRDSGRIASNVSPSEQMRTEVLPRIIAPLLEAGFDRERALAAAGTLASFVLGWVVYEQREETRNFVTSLVRIDAAFEFGLDLFIAGLVATAAAISLPLVSPRSGE